MSDPQRTRVIVLIHSHIERNDDKGIVDCSADVVELSTSKSIKGSGGFNFTLLPRKNYLNYIFPDDVVNIYMDPGDGKRGFVRVMMGYIDRIECVESVNDQGAMKTEFKVIGTDFTKAIDKTEVYFNPQLADRGEFIDPRFSASNLGGHALRTRGVTAFGTPAQLVENLLQLLLGFGAQWVFPRSYPTENFLDKSRSQRRQRAKQRLPEQVRNNLRAVFNQDIESITLDTPIQKQLLDKQFALSSGLQKQSSGETTSDPNADYAATQAALSNLLAAADHLLAYQTIMNETTSESAASLLDLLSLDFIEAITIDGFIQSRSIWTNTGSLGSMLYGWSNEMVNELCFDLRPVTLDSNDQCFGTQYSTEADELGINVNGVGTGPFKASVAAVQYVPAVVLREYPYSTVEGLDLSNFYVMGKPVGFQGFGPVFAMEPNTPGRKIYNYQSAGIDSLTPDKCTYPSDASPLKHLDVVTIKNTDVTGAQIGRSDADIFNLFTLYATSPVPNMYQYIIREMLPILTPVSIKRHGLRTRQMTTKFASPGRDKLCDAAEDGIDNGATRRNLVRWTILLDHWHQHNIEMTSGSVALRFMPEIRVGYRLDWTDRKMSYYVEQVQHQWAYPGASRTSLQLSRGQRNDPYPAYIPPILTKTGGVAAGAPSTVPTGSFGPDISPEERSRLASQVSQSGGGDRSDTGRLGEFFYVRDTRATSFSVGGEVKFSAENDIDKQDNVPGYAVFPNQDAPRDESTKKQVGDNGAPYQGETK